MVQLSADDTTNRGKIEPLSQECLQNQLNVKYGNNVVNICKVTIGSMDYEEAYNNAIAEKQNAKIAAEKQIILNQQALEKEANEVKLAEQRKLRAEKDKETAIINAEAEAEAYKIKSQEITPELLKKWELDARMKHGWVTIQGGQPIIDTRE